MREALDRKFEIWLSVLIKNAINRLLSRGVHLKKIHRFQTSFPQSILWQKHPVASAPVKFGDDIHNTPMHRA